LQDLGEVYEGKSVGKEDLRQVQDRAPEASGARHLREYETQTETGMNLMNNSQLEGF